jgi:hypothetical protein
LEYRGHFGFEGCDFFRNLHSFFQLIECWGIHESRCICVFKSDDKPDNGGFLLFAGAIRARVIVRGLLLGSAVFLDLMSTKREWVEMYPVGKHSGTAGVGSAGVPPAFCDERAPASALEMPSDLPAPPPGRVRVVDAIRWFRSFLASPPAKFRRASGAFRKASL